MNEVHGLVDEIGGWIDGRVDELSIVGIRGMEDRICALCLSIESGSNTGEKGETGKVGKRKCVRLLAICT